MALNGSGLMVRLYSWVTDRDAAVKIRADRMDAEMDGFATAISNAVFKDGQQTITANIPMATHKFTGLAAGSTNGDSLRYEQLFGTISGTLTFASGAAFSWNSGDVTQTHSSNALSWAGATNGYFFDTPITIGHTAGLQLGSGVGLGIVTNTSANGVGVFGLGSFSATASSGAALNFYRSKDASIGSATVVASGDSLGHLSFYGAQQTGTFSNQVRGARIRAEVSGTVSSGASGDMPTKLVLSTTADGGSDVTDRLTIDHTGLATFAGVIDISGAAAGQIVFPASQNASAGANTFDDYEEGTWTPGMTFNGSATGVTFTAQVGNYTKIGNLVSGQLQIILSSNGSGVGNNLVTGLPFTANGFTHAVAVAPLSNFSGLTAGVCGVVVASSTTIQLRAPSTTGSTILTDTNVTDTANFCVNFSYQV